MNTYIELMSLQTDIMDRRHKLIREVLNLRDEIAHDAEARSDQDKIDQLKYDEIEIKILDDMIKRIENILAKVIG